MPVGLTLDYPDDNELKLSAKFMEFSSGHVHIAGKGNFIQIDDPYGPSAATFLLTGGARVKVEPDCNLGALHVHAMAPGVSIEIGAWTSFNSDSQISAHEAATIRIGAGCLFGADCWLTASDVHKIVDQRTRKRLNPAGDIIIGEHVWLAPRTVVLRNTTIGRDCVVAHSAVVKGNFPDNALIGGAPARVIKRGIAWEF